MKFSKSLTIALLTSCQPGIVSAFQRHGGNNDIVSSAAGADAIYRMLKKNENKGKKKTKGTDRGTVTVGGGGGGGGKGKGGGDKKKEKTKKGKGVAELDTYDSGIELDEVEYDYGDEVQVTFELTNELVSDEVLENLDASKMDQWTVGVFMRMARPQDGAVEPILSAIPTITDKQRRRILQAAEEVSAVAAGGQDNDVDGVANIEDVMDTLENTVPVVLNHVGSATITDTTAAVLDEDEFGTGFDVFLLDQNGGAIIGPTTFYIKKDAESVAAAEKETKKLKGIMKHSHGKKKKKKTKGIESTGGKKGKGKDSKEKKGTGKGTGANGGLIIGTTAALEKFVLETDSLEYAPGQTVTVTYDIGIDAAADERRRMLKGNERRRLPKDKGGSKEKGKGKDKDANDEPEPPVATTTEATPPAGGYALDTDSGPPPETTVPSVDIDIDMDAATDVLDIYTEEEPEEIDDTDQTLFSVGVYMHMANPQNGKLEPLHKVPFCEDALSCAGRDLSAGEAVFNTEDLDTGRNGGGFDVWILNGKGEGIAGPTEFHVL